MTPPVLGTGISSQLAFLNETTWGVCASTSFTGATPIEFKSEGMELKKTTVQGQGLHAGGLFDRKSRRVLTNYDVNGTITVDLPNRGLGRLLWNMTGSPNQTVGGSSIFNPTQIATTAAYQSYHSPGVTTGMSLSWQKGVPTVDGVVEPFTYVGTKITDWEISVATGAIAQLVLTLDGRSELAGSGTGGAVGDPLNSTVPTLFAWSESSISNTTDPLNVFHFRQATLFTGTPSVASGVLSLSSPTALGNVTSASMKETKSLDVGRYFIGSNGFKAEQLENGFRQISGQFDIEWLSAETMYQAFAQDTTVTLQLQFVGNIAGTSGTNKDTLTLTIPAIKLDGESPKVSGPGIISQSCAFTGLDDESTTPYQFSYISSDASF